MPVKPKHAECFAEQLAQLARFKREHGHCNVPRSYDQNPVLGRWVHTQRTKYRQGELTPARVEMLEDVGFDFGSGIRGTEQDVQRRLDTLKRFRRETKADIPAKSDPNQEYASLSQWIYRMRKSHAAGLLSLNVLSMIEAAGLKLERDPSRAESAQGQVDASFQENFERLSAWLNLKEDRGDKRDLAYRDIKTAVEANKSYRFIEHMVLKARQGVLDDSHRVQIQMLGFTVNGKTIDDLLDPAPSIRSQDGAIISRAKLHLEKVRDQVREAEELVMKAELQAESAQSVADSKVSEALQAIQAMAKAPQLAAQSTAPDTDKYLTTDELALRIRYDARTIRDHLKDKVLIKGRHYVNPFGGRKILWVWATIERDMQDGTFGFMKDL